MRKPFLLFLGLISLYCWLTDLIGFLFYATCVQPTHKNVYSHAGSALILLAALITGWYFLKKRGESREWLKTTFQTHNKKEWLLLGAVSMPVILLGLFRSIFPDQNFDTFHFELYLQEFDLNENKINFGAGAIRTYYFPLPERVFGLFRHIVGYRLGTFFNTFLLVAIIASIYDFIKKFIAFNESNRHYKVIIVGLLSLFAVLADNTLFTMGSYKPDLIGIPVLLELIHLVLDKPSPKNKTVTYLYFFLLASLTITFKLTFLPYVGILCLIYFIRHFKMLPVFRWLSIPLVIILFPSIYMLYNQMETGNPLFPFFNTIFQSPLFPLENFKDNRWGYKKTYELFIYPVVTLLDKTRCNEWSLYSYRLLFGYFISLGTIIYYLARGRKDRSNEYVRQLFYLALIAVIFDYACLITTGYYRYGAIVEVLYGLIIALWVLYIPKKAIAALFLIPVLFQTYTTADNIFIKNINLSWHNYPSILEHSEIRKTNTAKMFRDYDHIEDNTQILPRVDAFVSMEPFPFDGLSKLLNNKVPIYDLIYYGRTPDSIKKFEAEVIRPQSQTKNLFVVATNESINGGIVETLNKKGFLVSELHEVYPTFMLPAEPVFLLKIAYLDTNRSIIKTNRFYLKDENAADSINDYRVRSNNKIKAFIREAPYTFNWSSLPNKYDLVINGVTYATDNRFENKKIFTVESDSLTFHKSTYIPYMIITQETENKEQIGRN